MAFCSTSSFPCRFTFYNPKLQPPLSISMSLSSKLPLHFSGNARFNRNHVHHNHNPTIHKIRASNSNPGPSSSPGSGTKIVLLGSAITVTTAIANRVLYKLALVPMRDYPFFLAQFVTFGYVVIYFSILYFRYRARIVTDEMLEIPKFPFLAIGFLEALGLVTGMSAGAVLPGPVIPILNQTFLVWQLMFSILLLRRRYSINQLFGCLLVGAGVVLAIASGSDTGQMLSEVQFFWSALMIVSCAFQAWASVIKENIFIDSATRLKHKSLDIFVVNSFGSGFQALFVLLSLPLLSNLKGIPFAELPSYFKSGAACLLNLGADEPIVASLLVMLSVPISVYILSLPLPYLPEGTNLSPFFLLGCAILVCGLFLYNTTRPARNSSEVD